MTTSPRIAWRPLLRVADHAVDAAVLDQRVREPRMQPQLDPLLATISSATRFQPSGSKAAAKKIGCGLSWLWKSNAPQRAQRCSAPAGGPIRAGAETPRGRAPPGARSARCRRRAPRSRSAARPTCRRAPAPCRPRRGRRDGCSARAATVDAPLRAAAIAAAMPAGPPPTTTTSARATTSRRVPAREPMSLSHSCGVLAKAGRPARSSTAASG